jgi:hypothetical protein
MSKVLSLVAGVGLAATLIVSATAPSRADEFGAGLFGGVLGFMAGAAIASSAPHVSVHEYGYVPDYGYEGNASSWRRHVRACFRAYGDSYDPGSNTFIGYDGYEHRCRL